MVFVASGGAGIVDPLDCGMAGGAGIVHGAASFGSRCLGRAQFGGQIGIGLGDGSNRGAVELLLRCLLYTSDAADE